MFRRERRRIRIKRNEKKRGSSIKQEIGTHFAERSGTGEGVEYKIVRNLHSARPG